MPAEAAKQPIFHPHDMQLKPGDMVTGAPLGSSSSSSFVLECEVHRGPRSAVWRAIEQGSNQPVALKVGRAAHTCSGGWGVGGGGGAGDGVGGGGGRGGGFDCVGGAWGRHTAERGGYHCTAGVDNTSSEHCPCALKGGV
jgi:hypothetical protein